MSSGRILWRGRISSLSCLIMMYWLDSPSGYIVFAVRVALALIATLHILRTKDDTASATGWIGVCWLLPITGTILYAMFGINRVRRLARKIAQARPWSGESGIEGPGFRVEGKLEPLARTVTRLTDRPVLDGNAVAMLHDGDAAYPEMLAAIDTATQSILLCSYIFRHDRVGRDFVAALTRAHQRGCRIHVLVDGIGSGYFICGVARALRREGVECRRFMHSVWPWRMPFINLRNHRKILICDGRVGFMGGLNIGEENLLRLRTKLPVCDTHFRIEGPILRQLTESFLQDWAMTTDQDLDVDMFVSETRRAGTTPMRIVTSGPDSDLEKIEYAMLQGIALARSHVRLMTPYFLPDQRFSTELRLAALRGVVIDIVVPGSSNHHLIDWARDANLAQFIAAGCRIWMAHPPFNHSKLMTVDEDWAFVGSANLDVRSLRLNFEINLEIYETAMTRDVAAFIEAHRHVRVTHHDLERVPYMMAVRNAAVRLLMPYL